LIKKGRKGTVARQQRVAIAIMMLKFMLLLLPWRENLLNIKKGVGCMIDNREKLFNNQAKIGERQSL